jgi:hypothetical protein
MSETDDKLRARLLRTSREELLPLAKRFSVSNFRKMTKDALVGELLKDQNRGALERLLFPSWWSLHHNHVYGVLTIVGLVWAIYAWWSPKPAPRPKIAAAKQVAAASRQSGSSRQASHSAGLQEADVASKANSFSSITLDEYYRRIDDTTTTALQRDQFQEDLLGKTIIWSGSIQAVEPGQEGTIEIVVVPSGKANELLYSAFLSFDASQKDELLPLRKGQAIKFTCVIKHFVTSPFLERCRLLPAT